MNDQNLTKGKATQFSAGEMQARTARKGGLAKAANARARKEREQRWRELLAMEDFSGMTFQERMDRAMIKRVDESGDPQAYEKIMEYAGLSPRLDLQAEDRKIKREELKLKREEFEAKKPAGEVTDIEDLTILAELINDPDSDD